MTALEDLTLLLDGLLSAAEDGTRSPEAEECFKRGLALALQPQPAAARDVLAERQRQITAEGWTPEHDDDHDEGEMAYAAAGYAAAVSDHLQAVKNEFDAPGEPTIADEVTQPPLNPWPHGWEFKPAQARRMLVKAGALILAEIERLDRLSTTTPQETGR